MCVCFFRFPKMNLPKLCPSQSVWLAWTVGQLFASEEESGADHIVLEVSAVGHLVSEAGRVAWGVEEFVSAGAPDRMSGLQVKDEG